jgi:hypothetical protein
VESREEREVVMNILTERAVHELLARATSKWIVMVYGLENVIGAAYRDVDSILTHCPWIADHSQRDQINNSQILLDGHCAVLFDTEDEARQFYSTLPTDDNPVGELLFFAQLFSPVDGLVSEST